MASESLIIRMLTSPALPSVEPIYLPGQPRPAFLEMEQQSAF